MLLIATGPFLDGEYAAAETPAADSNETLLAAKISEGSHAKGDRHREEQRRRRVSTLIGAALRVCAGVLLQSKAKSTPCSTMEATSNIGAIRAPNNSCQIFRSPVERIFCIYGRQRAIPPSVSAVFTHISMARRGSVGAE